MQTTACSSPPTRIVKSIRGAHGPSRTPNGDYWACRGAEYRALRSGAGPALGRNRPQTSNRWSRCPAHSAQSIRSTQRRCHSHGDVTLSSLELYAPSKIENACLARARRDVTTSQRNRHFGVLSWRPRMPQVHRCALNISRLAPPGRP